MGKGGRYPRIIPIRKKQIDTGAARTYYWMNSAMPKQGIDFRTIRPFLEDGDTAFLEQLYKVENPFVFMAMSDTKSGVVSEPVGLTGLYMPKGMIQSLDGLAKILVAHGKEVQQPDIVPLSLNQIPSELSDSGLGYEMPEGRHFYTLPATLAMSVQQIMTRHKFS